MFWTWKLRHGQLGRPTLSKHVRELIRRIGRENTLGGAPRIHGELLKLGIDVGETSVGKYLLRHRKPPSQTWRTFLENHVKSRSRWTSYGADDQTPGAIRVSGAGPRGSVAHVHRNVTWERYDSVAVMRLRTTGTLVTRRVDSYFVVIHVPRREIVEVGATEMNGDTVVFWRGQTLLASNSEIDRVTVAVESQKILRARHA